MEDESESEEEITFFPPPSRSGGKAAGKKKQGKKKRKRSKSPPSSEDEEPKQVLADSLHYNKQGQRVDNHPTMAKPAGSKRGASTSQSTPSVRSRLTGDEGLGNTQKLIDDTKKENEMLKMQLLRMEKKLKLDRTGAANSSIQIGTQSAMQREVKKCTKTTLWKICKFLKNHTKLDKATKFVMESLNLTEMEHLQDADLVEAQEVWKAKYSQDVRIALNKQRNYVQQELRELMMSNFKMNKEKEFPNSEQMLDLILRKNLDSETKREERLLYQKLFDNYWNVLMPKVAGHARWGPAKRHYELLSFSKEDPNNEKATTLISASDKAFLAVMWLNCYEKWWKQEEKRRTNGAKDVAEEEDEDDEEEIDDADREGKKKKKSLTPYTNAKSGQKKFGGWNAAGINKYHDLLDAIEKNRKEQSDYIKAVENLALERIRKEEKVDEKDAGRKSKKRMKTTSKCEFADEVDDENDYSKW